MGIRPAGPADIAGICAVSVTAGERFRGIGMSPVADDPAPPIDAVARHIAAGRVWVAAGPEVAGFLIGDVVDDTAHVLEVSVDPAAAGRRLGAALLGTFESWAAHHDLASLTLTTFSQVPWNRPYYERLGWHVVPPARWGPGVRRIRRREGLEGLDTWPRCVMAKSVSCDELLR